VPGWESNVSLPLPDPILNGIRITHAELRALHQERRRAIREATSRESLFGPRLLFPDKGEDCRMRAVKRDTDGNLLAFITVRCVALQRPYVRRVRLVRDREPLPWSVGKTLREV
jgi:hypothetical protein